MGNKFPQTDLPQGIRGASDQWDTIQAGVVLADDFFVTAAGAFTPTPQLHQMLMASGMV